MICPICSRDSWRGQWSSSCICLSSDLSSCVVLSGLCKWSQLVRTSTRYNRLWSRRLSPECYQFPVKCQPCLSVFKFLEDINPFRGATDIPVLDFWWCLPWVSKPGWIPFVCFLACMILRFTSGAMPADCIEVSMAAEPFWSMYLQMCPQALMEVRGLKVCEFVNVIITACIRSMREDTVMFSICLLTGGWGVFPVSDP